MRTGQTIVYQEIEYHPRFSLELNGILSNNKTFFIGTNDLWTLASLNSPLVWWFNWRHLGHGKDEALNALGVKMEQVPIAPAPDEKTFAAHVEALRLIQAEAHQTRGLLSDWYRHSHGIETVPNALRDPFRLGADQFVSADGASACRVGAARAGAVRSRERRIRPHTRRGRVDVAHGAAAHAARSRGRAAPTYWK